MLLGLRDIELRHPKSQIWELIDFSDYYHNLLVEWENPMPGIPFLPSLIRKEPRAFAAEFFRFMEYRAWMNNPVDSPRNRTCHTNFTLMSSKVYQHISSWVALTPRIFSMHNLLAPQAVPHTSGDEKLSIGQESLSLSTLCRLSLNRESDVDRVGAVVERTPPFENTKPGHVLPLA